uniref:Cilia- and flagella-associated protein 45 n=1 Tax=Echinostoma caproni TaxID=27848 RepID=A0A183BE53_9TREM
LSKQKFEDLNQKAKIITDNDEKEEAQKSNQLKVEAAEASNIRKQEMRKYDLARTKNAKLTDLEEEARKQAEVLLQKALEQRQDQEDEIKALNELILNAKIQAIRDEQILEKQQIKRELTEEELRLDNMMEQARQNAIRIQEEIDKKRQEQEMLGACEVLTQIQQNKQDRLLELEREEQENALTQQRLAEERMKDIADREYKFALQAKMRAELNEANDEMRKRREEEKERDRLLDLQIIQIQKEKA